MGHGGMVPMLHFTKILSLVHRIQNSGTVLDLEALYQIQKLYCLSQILKKTVILTDHSAREVHILWLPFQLAKCTHYVRSCSVVL